MPKFKINVSYCQWHFETYEIEVDPEQVEDFRDDPIDFLDDSKMTDSYTGDSMDGTFECDFEEINVLDRIAEAVDDSA